MNKPILLVEDDANDAFFMCEALKKAGIATPPQVVNDGQKALDYLAGHGKYENRAEYPFPCLVLLDLKLPHVMGLDVVRWIRGQPGLAVVVIIVSASSNANDIREAYRLGANAYVVKPSDIGELGKAVVAIRDFWLRQNTPPPQQQ